MPIGIRHGEPPKTKPRASPTPRFGSWQSYQIHADHNNRFFLVRGRPRRPLRTRRPASGPHAPPLTALVGRLEVFVCGCLIILARLHPPSAAGDDTMCPPTYPWQPKRERMTPPPAPVLWRVGGGEGFGYSLLSFFWAGLSIRPPPGSLLRLPYRRRRPHDASLVLRDSRRSIACEFHLIHDKTPNARRIMFSA